jgi:aquaporin Z
MHDLMRKSMAEGAGTFMLTFIGAGSIVADALTDGGVGLLGIAVAHGLALSIAVSATMNVSGGHINPAVTIAMLATRRIDPKGAGCYILAQMGGAIIAGVALQQIVSRLPNSAAIIDRSHLGAPALATGVGAGLGVFIEIILTALLVFAIFGTAVDPRAPRIGGFGIGLAITADILMGGPLTGAAMNPARAFGPAMANQFWGDQWIYWVGPIVGAVLAAFLYQAAILAPKREGGEAGT